MSAEKVPASQGPNTQDGSIPGLSSNMPRLSLPQVKSIKATTDAMKKEYQTLHAEVQAALETAFVSGQKDDHQRGRGQIRRKDIEAE